MKKSDIFALTAGLLGFVVDIAALIALLSGALAIPDSTLLGSSPVALAVLSFFSLVYSIILVVYFSRQAFRKRWAGQRWVATLEKEQEASNTIAYLLFIPGFWLWSIVIWRAGAAAGYPEGLAVPFAFFWLAGMMFGGVFIADTVDTLDIVMNPGARARSTRRSADG